MPGIVPATPERQGELTQSPTILVQASNAWRKAFPNDDAGYAFVILRSAIDRCNNNWKSGRFLDRCILSNTGMRFSCRIHSAATLNESARANLSHLRKPGNEREVRRAEFIRPRR